MYVPHAVDRLSDLPVLSVAPGYRYEKTPGRVAARMPRVHRERLSRALMMGPVYPLARKGATMPTLSTPRHMLSATALTHAVEVVASPELVIMKNGDVKKSKAFPGMQPYRLTVEWSRGARQKVRPDGSTMDVVDLDQQNITVWSDKVVTAEVGTYVVLQNVMIGAVDGSTYVQALGLKSYAGGTK